MKCSRRAKINGGEGRGGERGGQQSREERRKGVKWRINYSGVKGGWDKIRQDTIR